ncbi:hypothetical protein SUGI_0352020 [Cryptomeria japonica]|nr:hypothetical protein SUGI_0352020 [Cryptomeria japonica]
MAGRRYIDPFKRLNYFSKTSSLLLYSNVQFYPFQSVLRLHNRPIMNMDYRVACMSSNSGADGRMPGWLMHLQQVLAGADPPAVKANETTPKVALGIL